MTTRNAEAQERANTEYGAICQQCRHDLGADRDGHVYCSNPQCVHDTRPHPTPKRVNS